MKRKERMLCVVIGVMSLVGCTTTVENKVEQGVEEEEVVEVEEEELTREEGVYRGITSVLDVLEEVEGKVYLNTSKDLIVEKREDETYRVDMKDAIKIFGDKGTMVSIGDTGREWSIELVGESEEAEEIYRGLLGKYVGEGVYKRLEEGEEIEGYKVKREEGKGVVGVGVEQEFKGSYSAREDVVVAMDMGVWYGMGGEYTDGYVGLRGLDGILLEEETRLDELGYGFKEYELCSDLVHNKAGGVLSGRSSIKCEYIDRDRGIEVELGIKEGRGREGLERELRVEGGGKEDVLEVLEVLDVHIGEGIYGIKVEY